MHADDTLDLTGVPCPRNTARTLLRLEGMDTGAVLLITIDDGEPIDNVPASIEEEGFRLLARSQRPDTRWDLWIEAR